MLQAVICVNLRNLRASFFELLQSAKVLSETRIKIEAPNCE